MNDSTVFEDLEDGEVFQRVTIFEEDTIYVKDTSGSFFTNAYEAEDPDSEKYVNPHTEVERTVQPVER